MSNEKVNIANILRKCEKGTELYSPAFGKLKLKEVLRDSEWPIRVTNSIGTTLSFTADGCYQADECVLWPSKERRDWNVLDDYLKKQLIEKGFKPFEEVLVRCKAEGYRTWRPDIFCWIDIEAALPFRCLGGGWSECIPYKGNEHLIGMSEPCQQKGGQQ